MRRRKGDEARDASNSRTKEIVWLQIVRGNEIPPAAGTAAMTAKAVAQLLAEVKLFFNQFCVRIFAKKTCPFTLTHSLTHGENLFSKRKTQTKKPRMEKRAFCKASVLKMKFPLFQ